MISVVHREPTPNPNAYKYHTRGELLHGPSISFSSPEQGERLDLARALFALPGITAVLIAKGFVSVSGSEETDWDAVLDRLETSLESYDVEEASRLGEQMAAEASESKAGQVENELYHQIEDVLEKWVRPALEGDGGGVELLSVEGKVATIRYQGACGSCPTSTANTLMAIENLLHDQVDPEIQLIPG